MRAAVSSFRHAAVSAFRHAAVSSFRHAAVTAAGVLVALAAVNPVAAASTAVPSLAGHSSSVSTAGGSSPIVVEAQSPWVMSGQDFQMRLKIAAADPATDKIQVLAFSRLTTRSSFDNALQGRVSGVYKYPPVVLPLNQLQPDPHGGYDIDIPVNPSGSSTPQGPGTFPPISAVGDSGIYPLQIGLYSSAGVPEGRTVTTFLVYAAAQGSPTGLPKLNVLLVVPVFSPPSVGQHGEIQPVPASESLRLQNLVGVLQAQRDVPVSLAVSPQTLDVLQAGTAVDRSTLTSLASLRASTSDEILPATYARVSFADLISSGLGSELSDQISSGASILGKTFGPTAPGSTWVFDGPVDQATVGAALAHGATHLILPDGDLSPLPVAARETTFALPTRLNGVTRGTSPSVYAADTILTNDFNGSGGPVLAADRLLAELAMIQMETPGIPRGVAVVPPHRWSADPAFITTLLAGLAGHPLLQSVTASGLFDAVKTSQVERTLANPSGRGGATASAGGNSIGQGNSAQGDVSSQNNVAGQPLGSPPLPPPAGTLGLDASAIRDARQRIDAFRTILGSGQQVADQLANALLVAESTDVTEAQRKAIITSVRNGSASALHAVRLPGSSSITLTSTKGQVPLTILSSGGLRAHVELHLRSQRLIFRPFNPPGGSCRVPTPTSEICDLLLAGQNTTLKVPVEARSSGVFPLDVSLWTPGGVFRLAFEQNTVRSTAVSGVGVILIIVAVLSLALWWVRDLRHGRRARRLVPPPGADEPELRLDDPVVREFFENPPPGYRGAKPPGIGSTKPPVP